MDSFEERMRSWIPRSPSRDLEQRIFGVPTADTGLTASGMAMDAAHLGGALRWMIPGFACAVTVMLAVLPANGRLAADLGVPLGDYAAQHPSEFAALVNAPVHSAANSLPVTSFTWTNLPHAHSTNASFSGDNTRF